MKAYLQVTDSDFEIARIEEKRRRHVGVPVFNTRQNATQDLYIAG